jgi:hypothetical protein
MKVFKTGPMRGGLCGLHRRPGPRIPTASMPGIAAPALPGFRAPARQPVVAA